MAHDLQRRYGWHRMSGATDRTRFARYAARLERLLRSGAFGRLAARTQKSMIAMLKRLYDRLGRAVAGRYRVATAALLGTALALLPVQVADANDADGVLQFVERTGAANPLAATGDPAPFQPVAQLAHPAFGDVDGDGDLDAVIGEASTGEGLYGATLSYYENTGTPESPVFEKQTGQTHPLAGAVAKVAEIDWSGAAYPVLVDLDDDGDLDLVVGGRFDYYTQLQELVELDALYFRNDGASPAQPDFTYVEAADNPFAELDPQRTNLQPAIADLDADGEPEILEVGSSWGSDITYYENSGSLQSPVFEVAASNPFPDPPPQGQLLDGYVRLSTVDVDADQDLDTVVGVSPDGDSFLQFFRNTGSADSPSFVDETGTSSPFDTVNQSPSLATLYRPFPVLADIDSDGDLDLFVGGQEYVLPEWPYDESRILYFENTAVMRYPEAAGTDSTQAWIESVTIGPVTNISGDNGGYAEFLDSGMSGARGTELNVRLAPGFTEQHRSYVRRLAQQRFGIWIDANRDGDFDDEGEQLLAGGPTAGELVATITIPADAAVGLTTLRVVMQYHELGAPVPVGTFDFGEAEDYSFAVTE